ncbi:hypothetical protein [Rhizobium alvei]|uniref:Uncharacterized protein n=1 Tax=Rhizobium alvei TaxID=1132659 RepID=A0ABT8YHR9_9HYPH|nr:hypothetical protein [Rhizobium alvei]MDO6962800.1 hypothetical protein [Rhizobium alvei]
MVIEDHPERRISAEFQQLALEFIRADSEQSAPKALVDRLVGLIADCRADDVTSIQYGFRRHYWPAPRPKRFGMALRQLLRHATAQAGDESDVQNLAWLRIFSGNGYRREEALKQIDSAPPGAAFLAGLFLRLHDHVGEVRLAAEACFERVEPVISDQMVLASLPFYLRRRAQWQSQPSVALPSWLKARKAVRAELVTWLKQGREGFLPRFFRSILATDLVDDHLEEIALEAFHPALRARAAGVLMTGRVDNIWGWETYSISDRLGATRTRFSTNLTRPYEHPVDREALIRQLSRDRSLTVRKVALDGFIQNIDRIVEPAGILALYSGETKGALIERLDYIRRRLGPTCPP